MNSLMQFYYAVKFGFKLGMLKNDIITNVKRFYKGKKHTLNVVCSVEDPDNQNKKWITIQHDDLVSMLYGGVPSDFPMIMVFAITNNIGSFIVSNGFMNSDVSLQAALLEHEVGHVKEGHLCKDSKVTKILNGLVMDLDAEIAADNHVTNKEQLLLFLDRCIARPEYAAVVSWLQIRKENLQSQI